MDETEKISESAYPDPNATSVSGGLVDRHPGGRGRESQEREAAWKRGRIRAEQLASDPQAPHQPRTGIPERGAAMRMFAALAENVRDHAVFLMDPDGLITYWGEGARLMKWWTMDEVEGAHLRVMYLDGGSEDGTAEEHLRTAAERGEYTGEGQRVRSDGSTFWARVSLTALRDADGKLLGFAKISRDLTARHVTEAAFNATSDAAEAVRSGQEANRSRAEFLTTLSHEIRTPIGAVLGYADLLEMDTDEPLTEAQRAKVERIRASGRHLLGLVNDNLDLSRMEADRMPVGETLAQIGPAVEGALSLVEPQAKEKNLRLENEVSGSAAATPYCGDEDRVRQILVNLLGNAVKLTPPGGRITLSAGTAEHASPDAQLKGPGPWAWIRVEDTGPGIPPERLAAIFEPFEQVDMSGGQHGGSGLGVTISRRLAHLMGGDLTARSEVGRGSSFFLWLPTGHGAEPEPRATPSRSEGPTPGEDRKSSTGSPENASPHDRSHDQDTSRARMAFLAEASRCLADSLEYEATLEIVARLALPLLGSWSIVDLAGPEGSVQRLSIVHPDPEQQAIARELKEGWPPRRDDPLGVPVVTRTRRPELIPEITDEFLMSVARDEENVRRLRTLGMSSLMTVPMAARGRVLGAITFVSSTRSRRFNEADLWLAEDLAARCGVAIDNARLHRAARALAGTERADSGAEAVDQLKTDFLATVSHELRTPLNVMGGFLELLAMGIAGPLTTLQRQYLERVQAGEEQLLRIIEDMLNFVRLHEREIEYDLADVGLRSIVDDVVGAYQKRLEEKGLELVIDCEASVRAHTDPAKAWQILMNLLSNARKFTDAGGTVTVRCGMDGERPTVRVIDTGRGIPEEKLEAVFKAFVQADGGLTRTAEGMGLGLSISRQLARDMEGDLRVTSAVGEGTTFTLSLAPAKS